MKIIIKILFDYLTIIKEIKLNFIYLFFLFYKKKKELY